MQEQESCIKVSVYVDIFYVYFVGVRAPLNCFGWW